MPHNHVPEWYFETIRRCIIPRKGFGDGTTERVHNDKKHTKPNDKTITATDSINGELLTFSFHIEQIDEMKCYIIWNGQMSRFHGDFIRTLLPLLFVGSDNETKKFINSKQTQKFVKTFDEMIIDAKFERFYKSLH